MEAKRKDAYGRRRERLKVMLLFLKLRARRIVIKAC
jgi:hypothetical protein